VVAAFPVGAPRQAGPASKGAAEGAEESIQVTLSQQASEPEDPTEAGRCPLRRPL